MIIKMPPSPDFIVLAKIDKTSGDIIASALVSKSLIDGPNRPFPEKQGEAIEKCPVYVLGTWTEVKRWIFETESTEDEDLIQPEIAAVDICIECYEKYSTRKVSNKLLRRGRCSVCYESDRKMKAVFTGSIELAERVSKAVKDKEKVYDTP